MRPAECASLLPGAGRPVRPADQARSPHFAVSHWRSRRKASTRARCAVVSATGSWPSGMSITTPVHRRVPIGRHPPWKAQRTTERRLESTAPLRVSVRAAALAQPFGGILLCTATREIACVPPAGRHALDSRSPPAGSRSLPCATPPRKHASVQRATARATRSPAGGPQPPVRANRASAGWLVINPNSPDQCPTRQTVGTQMMFPPRRTFRPSLPAAGT